MLRSPTLGRPTNNRIENAGLRIHENTRINISMETKTEDIDRLNKAIEDLGEFFDTVQIFTTRHEPTKGGTITFNRGSGNWFARRGQIQEWMTKCDEEARIEVRPDNPDDGWKSS